MLHQLEMTQHEDTYKDDRFYKEIEKITGDKVLKVIIETCLLTDEEKEKMCDIVCEAGADYIKTSTGFSTAGANFHDCLLYTSLQTVRDLQLCKARL